MAYLLTAIMTGGVSAILSLFSGGTFAEIFWNYVLYGHLGMATLAVATVTYGFIDNRQSPEA